MSASPLRPVEIPFARSRRLAARLWSADPTFRGSLILQAAICGLLLAQFQLMRVMLLWRNPQLAADTASGEILGAFRTGIVFDFSTVAYLMFALLLPAWLIDWRRGARASRRFLLLATGGMLFALSLLGLGELEFYHEYLARYNSLAIVYWEQPKTVLSAIWHGFPVVKYLMLATAMSLIPVWLLARLFRPAESPAPRRPSLAQACVGVVVIAALVAGARGGVRGAPLDWGDAVHSHSIFANQLAQNGIWSLGRSAISVWTKPDPLPSIWPRPLAEEVAQAEVDHLLASGTSDDDAMPTPSETPRSTPVLQTSDGRPPNVVLIIMESFSARFCGACGADKSQDGYTPEFDKLARQGVLFDRCLSAGSHTHQANYATVCGVPNLPGHEYLMNDPLLGGQELDSLPRAFRARGYQTMYLYNGELSWENMEGFFRSQGMEHFVQRGDFSADSQFDSTWGVTDAELFKRANREFKAAKGPFFATICTMSNHEPFDLPRPLPFPEITDQGSMNKWMNGIRYADWAIGQFFAQARQEAYFKDTLFVLVGDHGFSVAPILTDLRLLRFHVPLLFYAPDMLANSGRTESLIASHLDIAPSIFGLTGETAPHKVWGKDLFAQPQGSPGWAYFKPSEFGEQLGFAQGNRLLVKAGNGRTMLYEFDLGFPASVREIKNDANKTRTMDRTLESYVETAVHSLTSRQMLNLNGTQR